MSCNPATKLVTLNVFTFSTYTKTFHVRCNLSSKFQGYQTFAELAFSQLADIPSFIPHFFSFRSNGRLQKHYESKHFQAKVTCGASGYSCGRSTRTEGSPTRGSPSPRSSNTLRRATGWRPLRVAPLEFMTS